MKEMFAGEFEVEISDIVNFYGNLTIKRCNAGYFWAIRGDGPDMEWKEIDEDLFRLLWRHQQNCGAKAKGFE